MHCVPPPQLRQVPASTPQACLVVPPWHWPAAVQQPAQVVLSQRHTPPTQCRPLPQGLPEPQPHSPLVVRQVSALSGSQTVQVPPPLPQVVTEGDWQAPLSQHPEAQVAAEQVTAPQVPATQVALEPHCTHAPPSAPQLPGAVPATHTPLAQQPAQLVLSQTVVRQPPSAQPPVGQVLQVAPPAPQALAEVPAWQAPLASQQPPGQLVASQVGATQAFSRQVPAPQDWHISPLVPHAVSWLPPRHTPLWQQPEAQVVGSQGLLHAWLVQAELAEHWLQATPPVPHAAGAVPATHTPFWQQPLGQLVGLQVPTHAPPSQDPTPQDRQPIAPTPQARGSRPDRQEEPEQQPEGQLVALHVDEVQVPAVQAVPPQSRHERPPAPHAAGSEPIRHRPPMQQPAQDAAVHWQARCRHSTPGSHAGPLPHWHWPLTQRSPPMAREQGGPEPQAQRPSAPQESAVSASHTAHSAPPVPQAAEVGERQSPAAVQHPAQLSQPDIGAARMTVTARSTPFTTATRARPSATTAPPASPSTNRSRVC